MPIQDLTSIAHFLRAHCAVQSPDEPPLRARLRAGRAKARAETVWRANLDPETSPEKLAQEIAARHSQIGAKEKAWLEVVERHGKQPVIDTLSLGEAPDGGEPDAPDFEDMSKGEIVTALVQQQIGMSQVLATRLERTEDRLHDLQMRHFELAQVAVQAKTMLELHERGVFAPTEPNLIERIEALTPMIEKVAPYMAGAWAAAQAAAKAKGPEKGAPEGLSGPSETPEQHVDRVLADIEAIAGDPAKIALIHDPVRMARLRAAAMQIMAGATQ